MKARNSVIFENSSIRNFLESIIKLTDDKFDARMIQNFSLGILL